MRTRHGFRVGGRLRDAALADLRLMFFAVPGRNPAWASPPKGEAGPGKAVLVATGFLWAGAERGRLLCCSGRFMRRDILGGRFAAALRLPSRRWLPRYSLPSQANRWR